jgi:chromosomal replication initiation ATPase DnaA
MTPRERHLSIIDRIATRHGITRSAILKKHSHCLRAAAARYEAANWLRGMELSWPQIGRVVGRHHTTVMHWAGVV